MNSMLGHRVPGEANDKFHRSVLLAVQNSKSTRNVLTFLSVPARSPDACQGLFSSSSQSATAAYMSPDHKDANEDLTLPTFFAWQLESSGWATDRILVLTKEWRAEWQQQSKLE
ncbi:unnamed protein product [Sphagnum balticum]